jgi:hypothetical protein
MSNATVSVASSGGDYDTLNHALTDEAANNPNLTTNCHATGSAGILTVQCNNFEDTTAASTGTGYTVSSSYYINIIGNPSDKSSSTTGKWSTSRYRLNVSSSNNAITSDEQYTRFVDLQVRRVSKSADYAGIRATDGTHDNEVINCIITDCYRGINFVSTGTRGKARNCIIIDCYRGVDNDAGDSSVQFFYNCTVIGTDNHGMLRGTFINCVSIGYGACFYTLHSGSTNNAASDTTPNVGSGNLTNLVAGDLDWVNASSEDYHIQSTSVLVNAGSDQSGVFTDDIDGNTRATWDIGADEYVAAGAALKIPIAMKHYRALRAQ